LAVLEKHLSRPSAKRLTWCGTSQPAIGSSKPGKGLAKFGLQLHSDSAADRVRPVAA
jgi:hypothetical protein